MFAGIQKALGDGFELNAFRTLNNLKIVLIGEFRNTGRRLVAYGGGSYFREACILASRDYLFVENGTETHRLMPPADMEDNLDRWIGYGYKLIAIKRGDLILFEAKNDCDRNPFASIREPTFEEAYNGLNNRLSDEKFKLTV